MNIDFHPVQTKFQTTEAIRNKINNETYTESRLEIHMVKSTLYACFREAHISYYDTST